MAKKVLKKAQAGGLSKDSLSFDNLMKKMQTKWNEDEKKSTNPKNKKTMGQIQKEWNEKEKKVTSDPESPKIKLFKKGGSIKTKKKK